MPSQGVSTAVVYLAYNTSTGAYVTGDVANHTIRLVKDGSEATPFYNPSEVDATNLPGAYRQGISVTETTFSTVVAGGKSSTANVILIPITLTFEVLPLALDANGNVKSDMEDIRGATVSTTIAQVGTNLVSISGTATVGTPGSVGIDWAQIANKTTVNALTGTTISSSQTVTTVTGNVNGSVGSVFGAVGSVTGNVGGSIAGSVIGSVGSVSATVNANMVSISGSAVTASVAQLGVNVVNIGGSASAGVAGYFGPDWSHVANQGTTVSLSNTTISASQLVSVSGTVNANVVSVAAAASNIKKNAATDISFVMTDATTNAPKTGLTVTPQRTIDGGAFANCTNAVTEIADGWYNLALAAADTNGNCIGYKFTASGANDTDVTVFTQP